jgi:hypothetical protein
MAYKPLVASTGQPPDCHRRRIVSGSHGWTDYDEQSSDSEFCSVRSARSEMRAEVLTNENFDELTPSNVGNPRAQRQRRTRLL